MLTTNTNTHCLSLSGPKQQEAREIGGNEEGSFQWERVQEVQGEAEEDWPSLHPIPGHVHELHCVHQGWQRGQDTRHAWQLHQLQEEVGTAISQSLSKLVSGPQTHLVPMCERRMVWLCRRDHLFSIETSVDMQWDQVLCHKMFAVNAVLSLCVHRRKIADVLQEIQLYQNTLYCLLPEPSIQVLQHSIVTTDQWGLNLSLFLTEIHHWSKPNGWPDSKPVGWQAVRTVTLNRAKRWTC